MHLPSNHAVTGKVSTEGRTESVPTLARQEQRAPTAAPSPVPVPPAATTPTVAGAAVPTQTLSGTRSKLPRPEVVPAQPVPAAIDMPTGAPIMEGALVVMSRSSSGGLLQMSAQDSRLRYVVLLACIEA